PLVVDLRVSGTALRATAPCCLPDLLDAGPALVAVELVPEGGTLHVSGRTREGAFERALTVPATAPRSGRPELVSLFGRESLEDLEMQRSATREQEMLDARIEALALEYRLASRMTSWIAVSEDATIDPRSPMRRVRIPHELAHGLSVEGLGLRPTAGA